MISLRCSPIWSVLVSSPQALLLYILLVSKTPICSSQGHVSQELEVNVHFENSSEPLRGFVEVSIGDSGAWLKVQTNGRDWRVGGVICRQLGLGPVLSTATMTPESYREFYVVICQGHEKSLDDCYIDTNSTSYYAHHLVLYVECLPASAEELDVALIKRLQSLDEGIVYTFVNGSWGPICLQEQDSSSSICATVCRQLGFSGCNHDVPILEGEIFSEPVISDLSCGARAKSLKECTYRRVESCPYPRDRFVEVVCHDWVMSSFDMDYHYSFNVPSSYEPYHYIESYHDIGSPTTRHNPALYLILVVVVAVCGVILYIYHKNRADTQRVFMDGTTISPQSTTLLPSTNGICGETRTSCSPGVVPPVDHPPPPYTVQALTNDSPRDDISLKPDPELPTYEETMAACQDEPGTQR